MLSEDRDSLMFPRHDYVTSNYFVLEHHKQEGNFQQVWPKNIKTTNFKIVWECIVTDYLWIRPTDASNSNFTGITTLHVSGSLSAHHQEFLSVHRLWYILCSCDESLIPGAGWNCSSILFLVANGYHNCIKCSTADVRLRTPDDGQKVWPKHIDS